MDGVAQGMMDLLIQDTGTMTKGDIRLADVEIDTSGP